MSSGRIICILAHKQLVTVPLENHIRSIRRLYELHIAKRLCRQRDDLSVCNPRNSRLANIRVISDCGLIYDCKGAGTRNLSTANPKGNRNINLVLACSRPVGFIAGTQWEINKINIASGIGAHFFPAQNFS